MNYNYACYECYVSSALQMGNIKRKDIYIYNGFTVRSSLLTVIVSLPY